MTRNDGEIRRLSEEVERLRERVRELEAGDISELKRRQGERNETEIRYRTLFDSLDAAVLLMHDAVCVECNPATLKLFGLASMDEIIGKTPLDFAPALQPDGRDSAEMIRWNVEMALKKGLHIFEWQAFRKSGDPVYMEVRFTPYRLGEEQYFQCIAIDITERKRTEEMLRLKENAIATSNSGIALADLSGNLTYVNRAFLDMWGYNDERDVLGRSATEFWTTPEDALRVIREVSVSGRWSDELIAKKKDGSTLPVRLSASIVKDSGDRPLCLMSWFIDISEQRRSEEALKESEGKYKFLIETTKTGYVILDSSGFVIDANAEYVRLSGHERLEDILGRSVVEWTASHDQDRNAEEVKKCLHLGSVRNLEIDYVNRLGQFTPVEISATVMQIDERIQIFSLCRDITERRKAEEEVAGRRALQEQIMDTASVAIFLVDKTGRITHANKRMAGMFRCSMEDLIGSEYVEHVHPSERDIGRQKMLALLASEISSVDLERHYWRKDGTGFWGHLAGRRFHDVHGNELGLIGVIGDITERKQAEIELRSAEYKYRHLFETMAQGVVYQNADGNIIDANPAAEAILGLTLEQMQGRTSLDPRWRAIREDGSQLTGDEHPSMVALRTGQPVRDVVMGVFHPKDDVYRWIMVSATPQFRSGETAPYQTFSTFTDITERRAAEELLRESEVRMRSIIESIPIGMHMYRLESDGRLVFTGANPAADRILGVDNSTFIGKTIEEAFPALASSEIPKRYREVAAAGRMWHTQQIDYDEGSIRGAFEVHAFQSGPNSMVAAFEDITARKRAEEALRESERSLKTLMGNLPGMAYRCRNDRDWTMEYVSEGATQLTGYNPEEIIGNAKVAYNDLIHPDDQGQVWNMVQEALVRKEKFTLIYRIRRKDGQERHVWEQGQGIFSEKGDLLALEGFITDMTDRHLLEEERMKTEKLEATGVLAGGIAHDFNNLLQGIFGYISMAKMNIHDEAHALGMLEQAEKALHLSVNLTTQLLTFSKGGKPIKKPLKLRPVIENSVKFALSGSRTGYRIDVEEDLLSVEADEGQIAQVIQNIVLNADQAMPLGGVVTVTARNVLPSAERRAGLASDTKYVEITIRDTGVGIPKDYLSSIFDPYFTTKEKGSGIGLATTYSIIRNHGGLIDVESEVGKGSTFFIYLPGFQGGKEQAEDRLASTAGRSGRVLVMDDDDLVRNLAGEMIRTLGHEVVCVEDGETAVAQYRSAMESGRPFDIVILDLTVRGGMGGEEAIGRLLEHDPGVKAIVSSGYSESPVAADYQAHGFSACLSKPYRIESLQEILDTLMK